MTGMILAAPLTAAAIHISADLATARAATRTGEGEEEVEEAPPAEAGLSWLE